MNLLEILIGFFVFVFSVLNLIIIFRDLTHIHPTGDDYLSVMSFTEWQTYEQIRGKLQRIKNGKIVLTEMNRLMSELFYNKKLIEAMIDREINQWVYRKISTWPENPKHIEELAKDLIKSVDSLPT